MCMKIQIKLENAQFFVKKELKSICYVLKNKRICHILDYILFCGPACVSLCTVGLAYDSQPNHKITIFG